MRILNQCQIRFYSLFSLISSGIRRLCWGLYTTEPMVYKREALEQIFFSSRNALPIFYAFRSKTCGWFYSFLNWGLRDEDYRIQALYEFLIDALSLHKSISFPQHCISLFLRPSNVPLFLCLFYWDCKSRVQGFFYFSAQFKSSQDMNTYWVWDQFCACSTIFYLKSDRTLI